MERLDLDHDALDTLYQDLAARLTAFNVVYRGGLIAIETPPGANYHNAPDMFALCLKDGRVMTICEDVNVWPSLSAAWDAVFSNLTGDES